MTSVNRAVDDGFAAPETQDNPTSMSFRLDETEATILNKSSPYDPTTRKNLSDRVRILRNLKMREYVRADALASISSSTSSNGPFLGPADFGDTIMAQAYRKSDPSDTPRRGCEAPWAGEYSFEIITLERLASKYRDYGHWKDISSFD